MTIADAVQECRSRQGDSYDKEKCFGCPYTFKCDRIEKLIFQLYGMDPISFPEGVSKDQYLVLKKLVEELNPFFN